MKKFLLKVSSATLGLALAGFIAVRCVSAKEQDPKIEETKHLEMVIKTAEAVIADSENLVSGFLDTTDNHSVAWYVNTIESQLDELTTKLIRPIERICNEKSHSTQYITVLKKTHTLLMEIRKNVQTFYQELKKNQVNKSTLSFAKAMKDVSQRIEPRMDIIRGKLIDLQKTAVQFDTNVGQQIQSFLHEFDTAQKSAEKSTAAQLKGIAHRLKC